MSSNRESTQSEARCALCFFVICLIAISIFNFSCGCLSHITGGSCYKYQLVDVLITNNTCSYLPCHATGTFVFENQERTRTNNDYNQPKERHAASHNYIQFLYPMGERVKMYLDFSSMECHPLNDIALFTYIGVALLLLSAFLIVVHFVGEMKELQQLDAARVRMCEEPSTRISHKSRVILSQNGLNDHGQTKKFTGKCDFCK